MIDRYSLTRVQQIYGPRTVLNIPALTLGTGEFVAVVGPSGSGKSTLLRLLGLLEPPSMGQVALHVEGAAVGFHNASIAQRRRLTMVFQRPALLSRSVYDNVAYGLRARGNRDSHDEIMAILERVKLANLARAHARTLSGGEMQRVALARALILEPSVLLLDEPTANLDPLNVRIIEELVHRQHQTSQTTIVMVTHNIFQARRLASRVLFILDGELVEDAPTEAFFTAPKDARTAKFVSGELVY